MTAKIKVLDAAEKACRATPTIDCRNAVAAELKGYIEDYWRQFKSDFYGRAGLTNTICDGTASTLTAAAAITTPRQREEYPRAARDVTARHPELRAEELARRPDRGGADRLDGLRQHRQGDRFNTGLDIKAIGEYNFARVMSDLAEYRSSMSLISALISLQRASGAIAQKVKDQQAETVVQTEKLKAANLANQTAELERKTAELRTAAEAAASAASGTTGRSLRRRSRSSSG